MLNVEISVIGGLVVGRVNGKKFCTHKKVESSKAYIIEKLKLEGAEALMVQGISVGVGEVPRGVITAKPKSTNPMSIPSCNATIQQIMDRVAQLRDDANLKFPHLQLEMPKVEFFYRGTNAGTANSARNQLRFNAVLAEENGAKFDNTISHEVAHLVVRNLYPHASSHGAEFKYVHRMLGGSGERCNSYDVSSVKVKRAVTRFVAKCSCREHKITKPMAQKVLRGVSYTCRSCKTKLSLTNEVLKIVK